MKKLIEHMVERSLRRVIDDDRYYHKRYLQREENGFPEIRGHDLTNLEVIIVCWLNRKIAWFWLFVQSLTRRRKSGE